jgi:hypothetical protein
VALPSRHAPEAPGPRGAYGHHTHPDPTGPGCRESPGRRESSNVIERLPDDHRSLGRHEAARNVARSSPRRWARDVTVRNSGRERGASRLSKIAEGRRAPVFTLEDAPGRRVLTADFKGKDVIVYFYPEDDAPGCTKEA